MIWFFLDLILLNIAMKLKFIKIFQEWAFLELHIKIFELFQIFWDVSKNIP